MNTPSFLLVRHIPLLCLFALSIATRVQADQFVLFDETVTLTKAEADASKSHVYLKADKLNPLTPADWTSPVDYRNGSVHIRMEVLEKPPGDAPTNWSLCYIPNKGQKNGYGCTGSPTYRQPGIYEMDVSMTKFWENDSILWNKGIKEMHLVIKDTTGGQGHAHRRTDHESYFPTKVRITMTQVSAGAKYVPQVPPTK